MSVKIYDRVKSVVAVKGPGHACDAACKRANHTYVHHFSNKVPLMGSNDGRTLTIGPVKENPPAKRRRR